MKISILVIAAFSSLYAFAYEGPRPLKDIKISVSVSQSKGTGEYKYTYGILNPHINNGSINSININLGMNPQEDKELSFEGYNHCDVFLSHTSEQNLKDRPGVPVGSTAPKSWGCAYGKLEGESEIVYGWDALNSKSYVEPGKSLNGFALRSKGLPGIRKIRMSPNVDLERLPEEYYGNAEKTLELYNKVRWTGKTVGPKAPPKVFDPTKFIQYIESLLEESSKLGWVKRRSIENSLDKQLRAAEKLIGKGGNHPTQKIMEAFLKEVKKFKKKYLSSEAYALLYYNGQYFLDHLEVKNDHKDHHDKGKHHGRDDHRHDREEGHHQHGKKDRHDGHRGDHRDDHHGHKKNHDKYHHDDRHPDDHEVGDDKYHRRK